MWRSTVRAIDSKSAASTATITSHGPTTATECRIPRCPRNDVLDLPGGDPEVDEGVHCCRLGEGRRRRKDAVIGSDLVDEWLSPSRWTAVARDTGSRARPSHPPGRRR